MPVSPIAGLDPGRSKCGLVLADLAQRRILEAAILPPEASQGLLTRWRERGLTAVVVGNGTGSDAWSPRLAQLQLERIPIDERGTTLAARDRYWELFPPGRWRRLLPAGLRLPPRDIDDVVAQLLVERHSGLLLRRKTPELLQDWSRSAPAP